MKQWLKSHLGVNENEETRNIWLAQCLGALESGSRLLDAGAGELRNRDLCAHLVYISQDICQYEGKGDSRGLQTGIWDTSKVDIICDITDIPEPDCSFDAILCSEVFEHLTDPLKAIAEFSRLLKPEGKLIITAPFSSLVHFAPYHFATGFSRYWYEHHLPLNGFKVDELIANGDWFSVLKQESLRLPKMARQYGRGFPIFAYIIAGINAIYFSTVNKRRGADDISCFGWHCVAIKIN